MKFPNTKVLAYLKVCSSDFDGLLKHFKKLTPQELRTGLQSLIDEKKIYISDIPHGRYNLVSKNVDEPMVKDCPQDEPMVKDCPQPMDMVQVALSEVLRPLATAQIALKCDLPMTIVSKYKSGKCAVSLEKSLLIASKLGIGYKFIIAMNDAMLKQLSVLRTI